jgi:alkaline phosphatase
MRVLVLTDVHFGQDKIKPAFSGADYINIFGSTFESRWNELTKHVGNVDMVVSLGDAIANHDSQQDKEWLLQYQNLLSQLSSKVVYVIGNHDHDFVSIPDWQTLTKQPQTYFSFDAGGFHHVVLHTMTAAAPERKIMPEQLRWLKGDLASTPLPAIIYTHYPLHHQPFTYYFHEKPNYVEIFYAADREKIRDIISDSAKVKLVVNGHSHFFYEEMIDGVQYMTIPSFSENDGNNRPGNGYALLHLDKGNCFVQLFPKKENLIAFELKSRQRITANK